MCQMMFLDFPFNSYKQLTHCEKIITKLLKTKKIDEKYSPEARDLIEKLICDRDKRMGSGKCMNDPSKRGLSELKLHPWFQRFNWDNLNKQGVPYLKEIEKLPEDEKEYKEYIEFFGIERFFHQRPKKRGRMDKKEVQDWIWLNYTFRRHANFSW